MLNLIKDHWLCLLIGMGIGWSFQFCPLLHVGHNCPGLNGEVTGPCKAACVCDDCVNDKCACLLGKSCDCQG